MTSAARATALFVAVLAAAFAVAALGTFRATLAVLERRDDRRAGLPDDRVPVAPRHAARSKHRVDGRRDVVEVAAWWTGLVGRAVGVVVRFVRDGAPVPTGVALFLTFSVLIGVST